MWQQAVAAHCSWPQNCSWHRHGGSAQTHILVLHSTDTACIAAPESRYTPKLSAMQQICSTARWAHVRASSKCCSTAEASTRHTKNISARLTFGVSAGRLLFSIGLDASTTCNCPRTGQPRWSRQGPGWMRRRWSRLWRPHQNSQCPPRAGAWLRCSHEAQQQSPPAEGRCSSHCLHQSHCNALSALTNIVMSVDP